MDHRPGLSRTDVLIALLLGVVAAGLVLAGVFRVREAADAASCQNNLRYLSQATFNYTHTFFRLPPLVDQGDGAPTGRGLLSVITNIFPFIQATPLRFDRERSPDYYHAHSSVVFTYPHKGRPFTQ